MPVSRALRRLFRVLDLQEEQSRRALDSALSELNHLERMRASVSERSHSGRELIVASAYSGELADRFAGLEEARTAARMAAILEPRLGEARQRASDRRAEYLSKRVERRQAGTLIQHAEKSDAIEAGRRSQQALDDWYLSRTDGRDPKAFIKNPEVRSLEVRGLEEGEIRK